MTVATNAQAMIIKPNKHSDREHSNVISPSSVARALACKASLIEPITPIPETSKVAADRGTQAHELWELLATKKAEVGDTLHDAEIVNNALQFLKHTQGLVKKIGKKKMVKELIEGRVKFSEYTYGTVDHAVMYVRNGENRLIISDLKCGSMPVSAIHNAQLLTYACCICKEYNWAPKQITICIVQPPLSEKAKVWSLNAKELQTFRTTLAKLERSAVKIIEGNMKTKPKEEFGDHCIFCKRKHECKKYKKESSLPGLLALDKADPLVPAVKEKGLPDITTWSDAEIAKALYAFEYIEPLKKDLMALAKEKLQNGEQLPGWKLVAGRRSRKWIGEEDTVEITLKHLGVSEPCQRKLRGITDIERELGKGKLESITTFTTPEPKVVQESDKRPAVTNTVVDALDEIKGE